MEIIKGRVIKGENIGEKQGYPTANLSRRVLIGRKLSKGVYVAEAELADKSYKALVVIGVPGIKIQTEGKVEVYFLNFKGRLYKKKLVVRVFKKLRKIKKFTKRQDLIIQIRKDIKLAKKYFN